MRSAFVIALVALVAPLAGCFGGEGFDFEPGTGYSETGNTVHLRMWVEDMVKADVYPGFKANLWAFCAEPANPNDEYSRNAIEYRNPTGVVQRLQSDNSFRVDEDATAKCSVPGPQLRVKQGDKVIVDFENKHFHPHTIHWHGQFVPWESDGAPGATQDSVVPPPNGPGQFRYEFIAQRAGTLWYHCHVDTQFHVMQGLYGVIIVEPQDEQYEPEDIDKEYTWVLGTLIREQVEFIPPRPGEAFDPHAAHKHGGACGASGIPGCQNPGVPQEADTFLINGRSFPDTMEDDQTLIVVKEGERVRLRIVNAGDTFETLHPHGHDMYVTHRDGNPLPPASRFWVDTLTIGPAERYDVVIEGNNPGPWMFHTHVADHETNDAATPGGMHAMIVYEGFEDQMHAFAAELPAGQPPRFPVTIPGDFADEELLVFQDPTGATETWTFPVEEPCAVEAIIVTGTAFGGTPVTDLLASVELTLDDPDGNQLFSTTFGGMGDDRFRFEINETTDGTTVGDLVVGDYVATLSSSALDATARLSVLVDYHPDLDAADLAAKTYGREKCGTIPQSLLDENGY